MTHAAVVVHVSAVFGDERIVPLGDGEERLPGTCFGVVRVARLGGGVGTVRDGAGGSR